MVHWREIILPLPFVAFTPGSRTMLVNLLDFAAGSGEDVSIGPEAALLDRRLLAGKRQALPASNAAVFQFVNQSLEGAGAGGGAPVQ
jgi:hypothetical protein